MRPPATRWVNVRTGGLMQPPDGKRDRLHGGQPGNHCAGRPCACKRYHKCQKIVHICSSTYGNKTCNACNSGSTSCFINKVVDKATANRADNAKQNTCRTSHNERIKLHGCAHSKEGHDNNCWQSACEHLQSQIVLLILLRIRLDWLIQLDHLRNDGLLLYDLFEHPIIQMELLLHPTMR